ncbi:MAG: hypothetical protein HRU20_11920 [Pseudomonadales bacterium]|nr:hypothetical protein [Pseudomonadales bacterium]
MDEYSSCFYLVFILFFLNLLVACAVEPAQPPDPNKYIFDHLQEVKAIQNWALDGWTVIDNRSLIIQTSPKTSYLLILTRENRGLTFANHILISSTAGRVMAKFDTVAVPGEGMLQTPIERIYKLDGKEQIDAIKASINGQKIK